MWRMVLAAAVIAAPGAGAEAKTRAHHAAPASAATWLHISSHLAENAQVSIDGAPAIKAPGYGQVDARVAAGRHVLKVTSPDGVDYQGELNLAAAALFTFQGKPYWCVNLLETALDPYDKAECQEEVSDRG